MNPFKTYAPAASYIPAHHIVSQVRVTTEPGHDRVEIWNAGGKAGTLMVTTGHGYALVQMFFSKPFLVAEGKHV